MKNDGMVQTPQGPQVPSTEQVVADLNTILTQLMQMFRASRIDGFTIVSIGKILSQLTFDGKQGQTEVSLLISKVAAQQVEDLKVWLLRQSIVTSPVN